ncbi:MAG: aminotransferase class V-fold PLP-dependent enzyme [Acidobacteriota bacterium]
MKSFLSNNAPKAIGPYSQAIRTGNLLYCSGQTPLDPESMKIESLDIEGQTLRAIQNLATILNAAGLTLSDVVKTNVYLSDMSNFVKMNAVYAECFGEHRPARTTVAVKALPCNALVEIECIAEFKNSTGASINMQSTKNNNNYASDVFSPAEIAKFRKDTEGCSNVIHLNNAGASLMPDVVTRSILEHIELESRIGGYEASALRADAIQQFYLLAGKLINCNASNIAFTASATDSYTRALSSIPFQSGDVILTDNDDFISNQIQFLSCQKRFGIKIVRIKNAPEGGVDLADLEQNLIKLQPRLLAITHIPTNSGLVQPVKSIAEIYSRYKKLHEDKTWYILDACQSVGQMKLDVEELKCDFLSVTNRKFLRGPRGTGFLYISDKALQSGLEPLFIDMRGAEWIEKDKYKPRENAMRFEDWEFAYALVLGTRTAIEYCLDIGEERIWQRVKLLSDLMRQELSAIDKVRVLDRGPEVGGLVTFTIKDSQPEYLVNELLKRKINVVPSYRDFAVIDFDEKQVKWAIRASPHYFNTTDEINEFVYALKQII